MGTQSVLGGVTTRYVIILAVSAVPSGVGIYHSKMLEISSIFT